MVGKSTIPPFNQLIYRNNMPFFGGIGFRRIVALGLFHA
jgi:hypothetical protein